ncbi:MAG: hypothetical protein DYG88_06630 [Chloroflexi bacterium CFX4]|nr:hypothetical protein [Chloroflexi bacterium CFX4]MDL1922717.1 hypothetical protein [Chloroflexi bacterium CFX3]
MSVSAQPEGLAPARQIWQVGILAAVVAAVLNVVVYFIASALGANFTFFPPEIPAPPFPLVVVGTTVIGVLAGTFVYTLMPRFSKRPVSTFRTVAIVVLVLSFAQPLLLVTGVFPVPEPIGIGTILALEIMHVIAGVLCIWLLTTRARA